MRAGALLFLVLFCNVESVTSFLTQSTAHPYDRLTNRNLFSKQCENVADNGSSATPPLSPLRRTILTSILATVATGTSAVKPAHATLIQFPCPDGSLMNQYHFMRAGESELEAQNLWGTNPMFLTNRENALSAAGKEQVIQSCRTMKELKLSQVKFPLAANAMDTAKVVKEELLVPGNLVVPEYTYLDQRGIGQWDMRPMDRTQNAIWAMDAMEAGEDGRGGLPPPNTDGTPNETLYNQVTRLRQLLSLSETYNSGDNILFIFPDGTGPALLSCLIAGIPLNRAHELNFAPGEIRMNISYNSVRALLPAEPSVDYMAAVERGTTELECLRITNTNMNDNVKDTATVPVDKEPSLPTNRKEAQDKINKAAALKRAQDQLERQRAHEMERELRNEIAIQNGQKLEKVNPTLFSIASVGLAMALGTFRPPPASESDTNKDVTKKVTFSHDVTAANNDPRSSSEAQEGSVDNKNGIPDTTQYPELNVMEELVQQAGFDIPEYKSHSTMETAGQYSNSRQKRDEAQLILEAEKAMEDYMNQDDGAAAFDMMMAELMKDDD